MNSNYDDCLAVILHHEGGFSNNIHDPGGVTNLGVTKKAWEAYVKHTVSVDDMKALTVDDITPFYKSQYWDKVAGDALSAGIDLCVFDFGVNAGTGRSAKFLQKVVGAGQDGAIGNGTLSLVNDYISANSVEDLIDALCDARLAYYKSLSTFKFFGKGWTARVEGIRVKAKSMV